MASSVSDKRLKISRMSSDGKRKIGVDAMLIDFERSRPTFKPDQILLCI